ncbi:hypothetical protein ACFC96_38515 [Streptomyces sp. NPDC055955]
MSYAACGHGDGSVLPYVAGGELRVFGELDDQARRAGGVQTAI